MNTTCTPRTTPPPVRSDGVPLPGPGDFVARIHRGAHEIGGSCIELAAGGARLVLDLGRPLGAAPDEDVALPAVAGLAGPVPTGSGPDGAGPLLGVVFSHGHFDHVGLIGQVDPTVPAWIGRGAADVLEASAFFSPFGVRHPWAGHLRHGVPIDLGPFRITPYLADHSAYDAYSLLVEAAGRRLLYTGDIRGHGRKARCFDALCARPPADVDVLLCEGTRMGPRSEGDDAPSERDLEDALVEQMRATDGLVAVVSSAQNIDRLVTVFRASRRAGRELAIDLHTATVAAATGRASIPQPGFDGLRVWLPRAQRSRVLQAGEFGRTDAVRPLRIFPEELAARGAAVTVLTPSSGLSELVRSAGLGPDGLVVWSLWAGYLERTEGRSPLAAVEEADVPVWHGHVSGHATPAQLARLVRSVRPGRVVPIHTEHPEAYAALGAPVAAEPDGAWWAV